MEAENLYTFLSITIMEIFEKMMSLKIHEERDSDNVDWQDGQYLTAFVALTGKLQGNIYLKCSLNLASKLTGKLLLMEGASFEDDEIRDAMGEIVNIVGGKFKALYSEVYLNDTNLIQMTVPTVVIGKSFEMYVYGDVHVVKTLLDIEDEKISVSLELQMN